MLKESCTADTRDERVLSHKSQNWKESPPKFAARLRLSLSFVADSHCHFARLNHVESQVLIEDVM